MPIDDRIFADRARAESFGSVAAAYDRYRPTYPDALLADLAGLEPTRVLDVACGTGKVAVALLAGGLAVLGVEVDPKMADVARTHGIIVEVGAFETWDDQGRRFDLITCGQGWHWIDPELGPLKAAHVLEPGGTLALFWNYDTVADDVQQSFDEIYRTQAPDSEQTRIYRRDEQPYLIPLEASGAFASIRTQEYRWERTYTTDEWIGRVATHSDHIGLPGEQAAALEVALRVEIDRRGGSVDAHFTTYAIFARTMEN